MLRKHGAGCLFQFVCRMMSVAEDRKLPLLIEFEAGYTCYAAKPPNTNWWTDLFKQPADVTHPDVCYDDAIRDELYPTVGDGGKVYHPLVWNPNVNKGIDLKLVTKTRKLLQRNLQLNPEFNASLHTAWQEFDFGCQTLAVHV